MILSSTSSLNVRSLLQRRSAVFIRGDRPRSHSSQAYLSLPRTRQAGFINNGRERLRTAAIADIASAPSSSPFNADSDSVSKNTKSILNYAINFARTSETFEVHSWALLLGIFKHESSHAAKILIELGITDLYGAWHEVLWALNVSNGLDARAVTPEVSFSDRALKVIFGAGNFAKWGGRSKIQTEDLVMALAAGDVLSGLFPDLNITFDKVRRAAAKHGHKYILPDDTTDSKKAAEEDSIF